MKNRLQENPWTTAAVNKASLVRLIICENRTVKKRLLENENNWAYLQLNSYVKPPRFKLHVICRMSYNFIMWINLLEWHIIYLKNIPSLQTIFSAGLGLRWIKIDLIQLFFNIYSNLESPDFKWLTGTIETANGIDKFIRFTVSIALWTTFMTTGWSCFDNIVIDRTFMNFRGNFHSIPHLFKRYWIIFRVRWSRF